MAKESHKRKRSRSHRRSRDDKAKKSRRSDSHERSLSRSPSHHRGSKDKKGSRRSDDRSKSRSRSVKRSHNDKKNRHRRHDRRDRSSSRSSSRSRNDKVRKSRRNDSGERSLSRSPSHRRSHKDDKKKSNRGESKDKSRSPSRHRGHADKRKKSKRNESGERLGSRSPGQESRHGDPIKRSSKNKDRSSSRSHKRSRRDRSRSPPRDDPMKDNEKDKEIQMRKERLEKWKAEMNKSEKTESSSGSNNGDAEPCAIDAPVERQETEMERMQREIQLMVDKIEHSHAARKKEAEEAQPATSSVLPTAAKWTLENESDEEGVEKPNATEEDEIDPLDAFMIGIDQEVKEINKKDQLIAARHSTANRSKSVIIVNSVVKSSKVQQKEELMESNIDGLEYSSEEEEENLNDTMNKLVKKRKELMAVDHNKIYYSTFRKDFYIEVPELTNMTIEEVEEHRRELENVTVKGKNCPKPVKSWAQCGVSKKVLDCLKKHKFEKPTPIQAQALPIVMSGRDMIGIAKTGSGKTLAFLIPMFRHILDQPELEQNDGPIAIIMTPTRELALQIWKECQKFAKPLELRAVCIFGGTGISEQIADLRRGAEIIVCTPGRMIDMLAANSGRVTNLRRVTYVVLDEADRMFDMGFEPQVMKIMDNVRPDRQTIMFSATFPRQMEALARKVLQKPVEVTVGGRSVVCNDVEQNIIILESNLKFQKLLELLGIYQPQGSVLVFVHKQELADELMGNLIQHQYPCLALHGGLDQYDRMHNMSEFKNGNTKLLIATSVCSRGLDVKDLLLVINYDCPNHYEDYVHRCGRTGRAGKHGHAYTFLTPDQGRCAGDLIKALQLSKTAVPSELTDLWNQHVKEMEAEGKKVYTASGFRGKGFKFDEAEAQLADERKKLQKAGLGLQGSDDEFDDEDMDKKIEEMFASRKRITDADQPSANQTTVSNQEKLEMAMKAASQISALRNIGDGSTDVNQKAVTSILSGDMTSSTMTSKVLAEQMAKRLNAKLGYVQEEEDGDQKQEAARQPEKRYEEELEINDFPQNARWKVTSKETLCNISEYSEAGVTVRGVYIPAGKQPKEGERKLYLNIEASSEMDVQKAKAEITRLIKEELLKAQTYLPAVNKSRYKVV